MDRKVLRSIHLFFFLIAIVTVPYAFKFQNMEQWWAGKENKKIHLYEEDAGIFSLVNEEMADDDLKDIKKRGKLIALTGNGPSSYFVYRGTPMGYEHDLLQLLAKDLGVELEIVIVNDMNEIISMLQRGEGDLIADNITITKQRDEIVDFTRPIFKTKQVLIQRKPARWAQLSYDKLEGELIRTPIDLIGKEIHVRKNSSYYARLLHLSEEIGGDINIVEEPGETETDELIAMVSEGKIPFTIADENTAMLNANYYPNIDVRTAISFDQQIAWVVRENSPLLLKGINEWILKTRKNGSLDLAYNKYYKARKGMDMMVRCTRDEICGRNISQYDKLIIKHAKDLGWDWRLLAALIYQESQFDPTARSWAGASGLMQLMPGTALCFGATNTEDPEESLKAGTKYLKWLEKYWAEKVPNKDERLKFIMASYNVGQEHVADAQRLTEKYKKDPSTWDDNVAYFLLQKSKEKYCKDPVVKYGYCRGSEPFHYVNDILQRYEHYKKLIKETS